MKNMLGRAWDFFNKNKNTALHILTLIQQEANTQEIKKELRNTYKLPDEQVDIISGVVSEFDLNGSKVRVHHLKAAIELPLDMFKDYTSLLDHLKETQGEDALDNYIKCVASAKEKDDILRIISKVLKASYREGEIDLEQGTKIIQAFINTTTAEDPFYKHMENVDKSIKNIEATATDFVHKLRGKERKVRGFLDSWENWLDKDKDKSKN